MVSLVKHDLEFILKQIKIAEAHSKGTPLSQIYVDANGHVVSANTPGAVLAISDPLVPYGLRTVDGSLNNLSADRGTWGASDHPFMRITDPYWRNEGDDAMPAGYVPGNNNDYENNGAVVDADPRIISNLIVDQTLGNPAAVYAGLVHAGLSGEALTTAMKKISDAYAPVKDAAIARAESNAAAVDPEATPAKRAELAAIADDLEDKAPAALLEAKRVAGTFGIEMDGNTVLLPNVAPDEGLSAPYNSWFTLFGQFFDHGLDLVAKKGQTIYIPLSPDDPLYNPASPHTNFMAVTRTELDAHNTTTPWVDQNQTYGSTASKQLFMREYEMDGGKPVATGSLLEGDRGLATWGDVKHQALTKLGFKLTDAEVGNIPLFYMDPYGEFIRGEKGLPQIIAGYKPDGSPFLVEGDLITPVNPSAIVSPETVTLMGSNGSEIQIAAGQIIQAVRTDHAFLDDIAHSANMVNSRGQMLIADQDDVVGITTVLNPYYKAEHVGATTHLLEKTQYVVANPNFDANLPSGTGNREFLASSAFWDNELLDAHYITGDGRGNENIGLSAVHHIFHSEHNHLVDQVKELALTSKDLAFLNEWLRVDLTEFPTTQQEIDALKWDGERLFQAARFTNEMEYQHLVFEEFARKVQPDVDAFVFNPQTDIDPAIFAEFAHVVYRFGHSMLNETVDIINADGTRSDMTLFGAFLNPLAFGSETIDHDVAAGAIVRGMTAQRGNEIDEFVTHVLRNQLVGIPLDLAAINIARGRETGMPSLNEARRQFQEIANGDTQLEAYTSWTDFALNLKNPASIVNFIAAYGTHSSITTASTAEAKRDAAMELVFGIDMNGDGIVPADRLDFLNAKGIYEQAETSGPHKGKVLLGGLELIDLWVGGLAEKKMAFGGMLGSTFSFIFELQLENLQNADRFYYLSRVQGLNLLNELENNSLAKMVLNNTDLGKTGYAVPGDIFSVPDHVLYVDKNMQLKFGHADPTQDDPYLQALSPMVERRDSQGNLIEYQKNEDGTFVRDANGNVIPVNPNHGSVANYIRVNTNDHVLIQGTNGNDHIVAGGGDDSVWGMDGDDRIEAGYGVDKIHGGKGDDIITNSGTDIGEVDMLHGEEGNDVIHGGSGLALIFGNQGQDFIITGPDGKEAFGGTGNDFILGGEGGDFLLGNEGDDWLEGGNGFDTTAGDNSELFFNSTIIGHDVMFAGQNEHDFDAESGDDIMVQGESVMRNEGMWGFDWAIHKGSGKAADADLKRPIFTTDQQDILRNRYDQVEALSGWDKNDVLKGDDRGSAVDGGEPEVGTPGLAGAEGTMAKHELTQAGVDRIDGMRALLGNWAAAVSANLSAEEREKIIAFDGGNILLGGGGSDVIEGRGGNDVIDGDKWLNVRIRITVPNPSDPAADPTIYTAERMGGKVYLESDFVEGMLKAGAVARFDGKTLDALMLSRTLNPGQLSIVREIVKADGAGDIDVAVFSDVSANYTFTRGADGSYIVSHTGFDPGNAPDGANRVSDGTDKLWNIERLRFADGEFDIREFFNTPATGSVTINDMTPTEGQPLTATPVNIADADGIASPLRYQWQVSADGGTTWTNLLLNANGGTFTPNEGVLGIGSQVGDILRVAVSFTDGRGNVETIYSAPTGVVGDDWNAIPFLANLFNGTAGDDIADGTSGVFGAGASDTLNGAGGNDILNGAGGNDFLNGGAGNDQLNGGAGTGDVALYSGNIGQFALGLSGTSLIVTDLTGAEGTDTLTGIETLRFAGVNYAVASTGGGGSQAVFGTVSANTLNGGTGNDLMTGGQGNDTIRGDAGNDTIYWTVGDGRDLVNGDTDAANIVGTVDTMKIIGDASAETYRIYAMSNGQNAGLAASLGTTFAASTEIVITRSVGGVESVVVELDNIEEIVINGMGGGDTFIPVGNFNGTSLLTSTITLDGTNGDDTVDITALQSAHRIVFRSNGGNDTIVGTLRSQDVIELAAGLTLRDYVETMNGDGTTTLASDEHSITYKSDGKPFIKEREEDEDEDHDDDQSGTDKPVVENERFAIKKGEVLSLTVAQLLANDFDLDGGTLSIVELDEDEHGTVVLNEDGTITFTPKAGFTGEASFTYMVSDGQGGYTEGKVTITVEKPAPVGEVPVDPDPVTPANPIPPVDSDPVTPANPIPPVDSDPVTPANPIPPVNPGLVTPINLVLTGSSRSETLRGGEGNDRMDGGRGHDKLYGGAGNDHLRGGDGHDRLDGGAGADKMWGGRGNDTYIVDDRGDRVYESKNQGVDTVKASVSYSLGSHVEKLVITGTADINGKGNSLHNNLTGNSGDNVLKGQGGHDTLKGMAGNDKLYGGSGNDRLDGGAGNNRLTGGSGDDIFVFNKKHGMDTVTDFRADHDRIDVSGLSGVNSITDLTVMDTAQGVMIGYASAVLVLKGVKESDLDGSDFIF